VNDFRPYLSKLNEWRKRDIGHIFTPDGLELNAIMSQNIAVFTNVIPWWETFSQGGWEPQTFSVYRRFIEPDSIVVDFGAWIGCTAMYAGLLSRNVYALEPDPLAYEAMAANIYVNPYLHDRVHMDHGCIAPKTAPTTFFIPAGGGSSGSSLSKGEGPSVQVDCFTLEDWMIKKGLDHVDFIKMDTEGGEEVLIPSFKKFLPTLPRMPHLWLSVHVPYWTKPAVNKPIFLDALRTMYPTCYLEATKTLLDYNKFDEFFDKCVFCTLLCTPMPFTEIPWDIDLARIDGGRIFKTINLTGVGGWS
jgi:FkbM family methyltransferase